MKNYITKRLLLFFPVVIGVMTFVFFMIHLVPGDPVELMLGENAMDSDRERLRTDLGLNKPIINQYLTFMFNAFKGDLGRSIHSKMPVFTVIAERFPSTIELALCAIFVAVIISIPLGVIAAYKQKSIFDNGSMVISLFGISMPSFWLGPILIIIFSIKFGWLPVSGRGGISYIILPSITLGTALSAILTRMTRSSMLDCLKEEYVSTARAKGLSEKVVIIKHALANAMIPIITIVGLQSGALLSGAIITETIFSWPGIGRLTIQAINTRDYPLLQGCVLIIALSYVTVNLLTDILYAYFDPRIKYE
ncbi:MAG: glutathione ABC transporter permease GsiC [Nitrospinae bacterium RIFCSPLOWO2_02_39_17]|nr:MAG: glutathione ABC transporter permease GsiC [Nitrospinae bacterium RIFCSPHIGHO2_02_39_11]OGW00366.1 MAG: glutathione ABC transporter permease GsiC [Nitrospinae bacterium RIFCSPHIGHO2_12_FULL_39_42]OGW00956.1 MAG: glutathione ABC transporter permease GsiC [Nitrospinae bacterium RIFCSPHIGHO2_02_FULL_39_82]OGW05211.1 MAG: glutathione ABC transporter permease GsiC [Nitrospinae bacterium RIFCSPLOWO2_02_39_17]OGW08018.1 MAG: glutathione ABC transporter permease GsiC [Nitrospinae bacterium RIFCS